MMRIELLIARCFVYAVLFEHWSIARHDVHTIEVNIGCSDNEHVEYLMALKLTDQTGNDDDGAKP